MPVGPPPRKESKDHTTGTEIPNVVGAYQRYRNSEGSGALSLWARVDLLARSIRGYEFGFFVRLWRPWESGHVLSRLECWKLQLERDLSSVSDFTETAKKIDRLTLWVGSDSDNQLVVFQGEWRTGHPCIQFLACRRFRVWRPRRWHLWTKRYFSSMTSFRSFRENLTNTFDTLVFKIWDDAGCDQDYGYDGPRNNMHLPISSHHAW